MQNIGAVVLAAGESSRLGQPKQLLRFRGQSLVRRVVEAAEQAGCCPTVVVIGSDAVKVESELSGTRATIVKNANWRRGIGSSIRSGLQGGIDHSPNVEATLLLTCDQPLVDANTIDKLVSLRQRTNKAIIASAYAGTLGIPALFDRSCFQELLKLSDDHGAKEIILLDRQRVAEFPFPEGVVDIDTMADYEKYEKVQPP
jgi:molybdenum cofactor cytidylyltransferase